MTTCDWCGMTALLSDLFNVDYLDSQTMKPSGFANVLCENCLQDAIDTYGEELVEAWN